MNLLFFSRFSVFTGGRIGGAETSMALMAEKLAARGHKIYYLSFVSSENDQLDEQQGTQRGITLLGYLPKRHGRFLGVKIRCSPEERRRHLEHFLQNTLSEMKIDLVYSHYDREVLLAFLTARERVSFKIVMRMAGLKWYEEIKNAQPVREDYIQIFSSVDAINYNTPGLKTLCHQKAGEINLAYVPRHEYVADIGARVIVNQQNELIRPPGESFEILVATRFSNYQKRQDILVRAIALLKNRSDIRVKMIGSGPEKENIRSLIKGLGMHQTFEIIDFLPQQEIWSAMDKADLLCHPCEYEGLSKIIVESMMVGLPVLASKVVPLDDYLEHGKTGFLVNNTPEAWAREINEIIEKRDQLLKVSQHGIQFALEHFNPNTNVHICEQEMKKLVEVY